MNTHLESSTNGSEERAPKRGWAKFMGCVGDCLRDENKEKWAENMRGSLGLMATIIATMTFQLATNPPGGVFQANGSVPVSDARSCLHNYTIQCPGEAVFGVVYSGTYKKFLISNTLSFIASVIVCLLLVSGIPIKHRFIIWSLSFGMCITITSLTFTYLYAASMVTPNPIWDKTVTNMFNLAIIISIGLLGLVSVFVIIRMVSRVIKWITKCCRPPAPTRITRAAS